MLPLRAFSLHNASFSLRCFASSSSLKMADHGKAKLKAEHVIPDVLDDFSPSTDVHVAFAHGKKIDFGNVLHPVDVTDGPTSITWTAEPGALYTLVKTDPDAPSRKDPKYREWCHWIVGNIPGSDYKKGDPVWDYVGSAPPKGSGLHRYVYIVFKQPGNDKIDFSSVGHKKSTTSGGRGGFKVRDMAKKLHLMNFFQAEWDDSVPKVYAKFTD